MTLAVELGIKTLTLTFDLNHVESLATWAQFHKRLLNIEDSMLLNLDLSWLLVATTKLIYWADTWELVSSLDSKASCKDSLLITTVNTISVKHVV